MTRRIPVLPTLLVVAAALVMVRLGFWQLDRLHQKEALLSRYKLAQSISADAPWPSSADQAREVLYRHAAISCAKTEIDVPIAGHNRRQETGWAHVIPCQLADGRKAEVVIGWSRDSAARVWNGGAVQGVIAQGIRSPARLIADPPLAGLEASAMPDPKDIPNNHLSYAFQWFLFAVTALVIYALALRKRGAA